MGNLFARLAQGLGTGMQQAGAMGMEEQRMNRLAKMREASQATATKASQEFQTSEREASQEFERSMAKVKGGKPDKVKFSSTDDMDDSGKVTITYESGRMTEYDPTTDITRELGKGKGEVDETSKSEDVNWGKKMADREASVFSGDASDFPHFKSEEKAAEAAAQFRTNARKAGTIDEFDTEFAKRGWSYIQELAGGASKPKPKAKAAKKETGGQLMSVFKDFKPSDYDAIAKQILSDPNSGAALKKEATDYLSTGT